MKDNIGAVVTRESDMGINPMRRDNIMQNLALETNALENERKRMQGEKITKKQQTVGKILFWTLLILLVAAIGIYVSMHL